MKAILLVLFFAAPLFASGEAPNTPVPINSRIGFDQKLGAPIPLDLVLNDESGNPVSLGSYFGRGPVVLALVYYGCPNLCTMVINGLFKALHELPFDAGKTFHVLVVSIDPREGPELALKKKKSYLTQYRRPGAARGLHFLTGREKTIQALAKAVGFRYEYDAVAKQYAHPAGITVLTSDARVSRYLYGIEYAGKDLRLSLVEASGNRIGTLTDKFLLLCYHYDSAQGGYTARVMAVLRALAVATVAALGGAIFFLLRREGMS